MTTTKKPVHQQERPDWQKKHIEQFDLKWGHLKPSNLYDIMLLDELNKIDRGEISEQQKPTYEQLQAENEELKAELHRLKYLKDYGDVTAKWMIAEKEIATLKKKLEKATSQRDFEINMRCLHSLPSRPDLIYPRISEYNLELESIKE